MRAKTLFVDCKCFILLPIGIGGCSTAGDKRNLANLDGDLCDRWSNAAVPRIYACQFPNFTTFSVSGGRRYAWCLYLTFYICTVMCNNCDI